MGRYSGQFQFSGIGIRIWHLGFHRKAGGEFSGQLTLPGSEMNNGRGKEGCAWVERRKQKNNSTMRIVPLFYVTDLFFTTLHDSFYEMSR
ncbi:hypothetical protein EYC80_002610 [Monilinia laxa]|uniref:Uncharacterized protein n=1 Tax=Monilinia laxa TaxID=61186 RepID=A0A5N6K4K4_MONLA|nr:hypothetical protein EYC80_002610 [Monilinia laxa]